MEERLSEDEEGNPPTLYWNYVETVSQMRLHCTKSDYLHHRRTTTRAVRKVRLVLNYRNQRGLQVAINIDVLIPKNSEKVLILFFDNQEFFKLPQVAQAINTS